MKKIIWILFLIISVSLPTFSEVFTDTVLHDFSIEFYDLDASNWRDTLLAEYYVTKYDSTVYRAAQIIFDGDTLDSVGVRYKGEFSMSGVKKPFKLKFDKFIEQKLDGVKKLNLQGAMEDASQMHDKTCYDMFEWIGVPGPRTSFTKVTVEGEYYGLMTAVEQVDKQFRKYNYEKTEGNLYKGFFGTFGTNDSDLTVIELEDIGLHFEPKNHKAAPSHNEILELYTVVDTTPDSLLGEELRKRVEMTTFLKHMAVDMATTSYDNFFCGAGANIYYFIDSAFMKLHTIPWDYNLSLFRFTDSISITSYGEIHKIVPWDTTVIWGSGNWENYVDNRFMQKKIIRDGVFKDSLHRSTFFKEVGNLANSYYEESRINSVIDGYYDLIKDAVYADPTVNNGTFEAEVDSLRSYFKWQRKNILDQLSEHGYTLEPFTEIGTITLDKKLIRIGLGDAYKVIIPVTVSPANATYKNLEWSSADRDIAKVSAFGEVEGKAVGTTTITVSSLNGGAPKDITVEVYDSSVDALIDTESLIKREISLNRMSQQKLGLYIPLTGNYTIKLSSLNGQVLYAQQLHTRQAQSVNLDMSKFAHQVLILTVEGNGICFKEKIPVM